MLAIAVGLVLFVRPLSLWLLPLAVDGTLEPATARFLDALWLLVFAAGLLALWSSFQASMGAAFAGMLGRPPEAVAKKPRSLVPLLALLTLVARLVVSARSDIGLGDDGGAQPRRDGGRQRERDRRAGQHGQPHARRRHAQAPGTGTTSTVPAASGATRSSGSSAALASQIRQYAVGSP